MINIITGMKSKNLINKKCFIYDINLNIKSINVERIIRK